MPDQYFSRRHFLNLLSTTMAAGSLLWPKSHAADIVENKSVSHYTAGDGPTVGIALGGGGANGLAHILMLEALDEMHIKPHRIAGSSIGAIIGALYCAGKSGKQIRGLVEQFIISPDEKFIEELINHDALRWVDFIEIELGKGGLLNSGGFISYLYDILKKKTFEQLAIPLKVTAADLWNREQVVFQSGELIPAIKASMALPGVFEPVVVKDRVLVDGGAVNPVPYDLLTAECDIVIAIDVSGERTPSKEPTPSYFETVFNSVKVMQQAIMSEKLRHNKPAIYLTPRITDIRALEFYRAEEVFKQAQPAKEELKRRLSKVLSS